MLNESHSQQLVILSRTLEAVSYGFMKPDLALLAAMPQNSERLGLYSASSHRTVLTERPRVLSREFYSLPLPQLLQVRQHRGGAEQPYPTDNQGKIGESYRQPK